MPRAPIESVPGRWVTAERRWAALVIALGLIAGVVAVYAPVAGFELVSLDDPGYITGNPHVPHGLSWEGVGWAFTSFHKSNWHPLTWLSHMLDVELFGLAAGPPHVVNAGLHALNAVLLFLALRAMSGALWTSAAVAALFAFHPMRVESVAWVAERKDVLSGLLFMTTLLAYTAYARRPTLRRYGWVGLSFALGLLAKPMLVTLPALLLLLDLWPLGRWRPRGSALEPRAPADRLACGPVGPRRLLLEKLPLGVLALGSSAVTIASSWSSGAMGTLETIPLGPRLTNALLAYGRYLQKTFWPLDLGVFYPHPALVSVAAAPALLGSALVVLLLLAGVSILAVRQLHRLPWLLVGWLWFLGMLVPVIGILQVGFQAFADRFSYLSLIGVYIAVAWSLRAAVQCWPIARLPLVLAVGLVLAACLGLSREQVRSWRNSVTLFERAIAVTDSNYFAHGNLGSVLLAQGHVEEAIEHYLVAISIRPVYATAQTGLGVAYLRQGRLEEAAERQREAARLRPDSPVVLTNLGAVLFRQRELDEAARYLERALELAPEYAMAHSNLGSVESERGNPEAAAAHFETSLRLRPGSASTRFNLAIVRVRQGRLLEAQAELERSLQLQPGFPAAERLLRGVRQSLGR